MIRIFSALVLAVTLLGRPAVAQQDMVWVQIEAQPTLAEAQQAIRRYAERLQDVNGFALDGGWYAVALGPYARGDAGQVLNVLRSEGAIPRDSYIAFPSAYRRQFYPAGAGLNAQSTQPVPEVSQSTLDPAPEATDDSAATTDDTAAATQETTAPDLPPVPDETPAEARRSEAQLTREERMELQVMLRWAGFYDAAIDGAFGRGTRASMSAWQEANNREVTGVLTTGQRAALERQYNAVLEGLGLRRVRDARAGIEMVLPADVVELDRYEAPFAHYTAKDDSPARVVLISQEGDRDTLRGLYEIMQTHEIVPLRGERNRRESSFFINGRNERIRSFTEVSLEDGAIKGFTLVWPAGEDEQFDRLLGEMRKSFTTLPGVLPASAGVGEDQRIDLVSGLEIRKPVKSRSGFFVDDRGTAVTVADAVEGCSRVTLNHDITARVLASDAQSGLAVLQPVEEIAPMAAARLSAGVPRLQSDVAVAGFPYEGVLGAPTLTFGQLADLRGLNGEENLRRLALNAQAGDAGGPVFDTGGAVLGVLLPQSESAQRLPGDVSFAADAAAVQSALSAAGIDVQTATADQPLAPEDLTDLAAGMTVLVGCWE
ncbi:MAG: trypsin-like peptidase domain-containing protein [Pseudooceanicola sp.]